MVCILPVALFIWSQTFIGIAESGSLRWKRQFQQYAQPQYTSPFVVPGNGGFAPYQQPAGYNPALFSNPDTNAFNFGVGVNPGRAYNFGGKLNFPIINKDQNTFIPFNLNGDFRSANDNFGLNYGHSLKGVNPHELPFAEVYPCLFGISCGQQQQQPSPQPVYPQPSVRGWEQLVTPMPVVLTQPPPTSPPLPPVSKGHLGKQTKKPKKKGKPNRFGTFGQPTRAPRPAKEQERVGEILTGTGASFGRENDLINIHENGRWNRNQK